MLVRDSIEGERMENRGFLMENNSFLERCATGLVVAATLVFFVFSYYLPKENYDLVGMVASALSFEEQEKKQLHETVYSIVKQSLPPEHYEKIIAGNEDRVFWRSDAEAFSQNLPFYQPRILLTLPVFFAYKLGINPVHSINFITSLSVSLGVFFFYLAFCKIISIHSKFLFSFLVLLSGALDVARIGTSDSLVFFLFGLFVYLISRRMFIAVLIFPLLPAARSDMIMLVFCMFPMCYLLFKHNTTRLLLAAISSLAVYFIVNSYFGNYGWKMQFYNVNVDYVMFPADTEITVTFTMYLKALVNGLLEVPYNLPFVFFLVCFSAVAPQSVKYFYLLFNSRSKPSEYNQYNSMMICAFLAGLFVAVHYVAFPLLLNRYFSGQYFLVMLMTLAIIDHWRGLASFSSNLDAKKVSF